MTHLDASGHRLMRVNAMNQGFELAPYYRSVSFSVSAPTPVCIVVSREDPSGRDLERRLAQIPVTLSPIVLLPDTGNVPLQMWHVALALMLLSGGVLLRRACNQTDANCAAGG